MRGAIAAGLPLALALAVVPAAGCAGPPGADVPAVRIAAARLGAAPGPPRSLDPLLLPHWRRSDGRARALVARHVARWEAELLPGACLEARPASGRVTASILYADASRRHATVVAWGRGVLALGPCGQAELLPVDAPAAPLALAIGPGERVDTALAPGGATATELYALAGGAVVALDLGSGVGGAARLALPDGADAVLVAAGPDSPEGPVLLYLNDIARDGDGDGLGAGLEADLGTSDAAADSDGDGIDDGIEALGFQVPPDPPQLLPAWGASPTHKDLFAEIDWEDDGGVAIGFVDGPSVIEPTALHFAHLRADSIANPDGGPGVALHVDSGVPSGGTTYGDWGGFSIVARAPDDAVNSAQGWGYEHAFAPSRRGIFHYVFTHSRLGPAWGLMPGDQVVTHHLSQSAFQEELGHNVNLGHHGAGRGINCKPNYRSHMNYAFNGEFSDGRFAAFVLNPLHLDETRGLGVPAVQAAFLQGAPFYYTVRADGAIDWNRDGRFDPDVRAWINYPAYFGFSCEAARYRVDGWGGTLGPVDPARGALGRDGARLVVFYVADGQLTWRAMTDWVGCPADPVPGCGNWTAAAGAGVAAGGGVAAASLGGVLHLVLPAPDGRLLHLAMGPSGPVPVGDGRVTENLPTTVDPGLVATANGLLLAYAGADGRLVEQIFDGAWSPPVVAGPDDLRLDRDTGVALAEGAVGADPTPVVRAAVVAQGQVRILARTAAGYRVEPDAFLGEPPQTDRSPGLGYAPLVPGGPLAPGRFTLVFRGVGATHVMRIDWTDAQGRFAMPALQDNIWATSTVGPSLFYDAGGGNLRMVRTDAVGNLQIWPYADGLFDVDMHDVDDAAIVRSGICFALRGCGAPECPPPPALITGCGGTQPNLVVDGPTDIPPEDPF